ncbi:MAG: PadR family transcriptional regulator [Paracoccaceae bacterium]
MAFKVVSPTEYAVLDILRVGREFYGLEMVRRANGALKRGTIYVLLGRMEKKGLVASRQEDAPQTPGMPRRLYKITGVGVSALQAEDVLRAQQGGAQHV